MYYFPIYEYEFENEKYKIVSTSGIVTKKSIEIGKIVEIKYNPDNPVESYPVGNINSKLWLILAIIGSLIILEGIVIGNLVITFL